MTEQEKKELFNYVGSITNCEINEKLIVFGLTPYLISKIIKAYNLNIIDFNKTKEMITKVLSGPIEWSMCMYIVSFEFSIDRLITVGITNAGNECKGILYFK